MSDTGAGRAPVALMIESDGPGGAETMLLQLGEELRRRGREVVPVGPAVGCGWLAEEWRRRGFEPEAFTLRGPLDPGCVRGLAEMFRRRGVGLVHSHEFTMAVYGAAAARRAGVPHVITMHGGTGFAARWRRRAAARWAFRASAAVVAVSEPTRTALAGALGIPERGIEVVPNGIVFRPGERERVRAELGLADDEQLVLAVGNLYPVKGHATLIRALARIRDERWRLAIAGRGGEHDALHALARSEGVGDRVHLLGYRADVPDLLAACDVYAMPSLSEGLPMALVEAMFASRAIVASAVGGIPGVIDSGEHGVLVPPRDEAALAEALRPLLRSGTERERLAAAAHRRAREGYGAATMADRYERIFAAAAGLPRRRTEPVAT